MHTPNFLDSVRDAGLDNKEAKAIIRRELGDSSARTKITATADVGVGAAIVRAGDTVSVGLADFKDLHGGDYVFETLKPETQKIWRAEREAAAKAAKAAAKAAADDEADDEAENPPKK